MDEKEQRLITKLIFAIENAYERPWRLYIRQFFLGLAYGLGATMGVAIILAGLSYALHLLGGLPVVGEWFNNVQTVLPSSR